MHSTRLCRPDDRVTGRTTDYCCRDDVSGCNPAMWCLLGKAQQDDFERPEKDIFAERALVISSEPVEGGYE